MYVEAQIVFRFVTAPMRRSYDDASRMETVAKENYPQSEHDVTSIFTFPRKQRDLPNRCPA